MGNSTGPRTPRGKARSSQNAAKHWIESGRILPAEQKEAAILRSGFEEDFKPQGPIEHEIVDDLVFNRLHKRRIDIVFTREFSKATIEKAVELRENSERPIARYWLRLAGVLGRHSAEPAGRLNPSGCIQALQVLMKQIRDRGPQPGDLEQLRVCYGDQPTEQAAHLMYLLARVAADHTAQNKAPQKTCQDELKQEVLDALQTEIEQQKESEELAGDLLAIECASDLQEPPRPALETLLRYRAANTREFKDLLDSLERIRRLRRSAA